MLLIIMIKLRKRSASQEGRLLATYAPPSSCLASTKRVLMTDAQDSPLSGRFLLRCEQCFVRSISLFGTENIKCVREILSFRSRRENLNCSDSSIVVFLPKFAIINTPLLASHLDLNFHVFVKRDDSCRECEALKKSCRAFDLCRLSCSVNWVGST